MDKAERNALIDTYGTAFENFVVAINEVPKQIWQFKPEPKEWSVHEIIVHLADSETNSYLRARRLVAEPGGTLMAYDQDVWAIKLNYHEQNTDDALQVTKWVRKTTYDFIKQIPEAVWENTAVHPEYPEPYTFEKWLKTYANHPNVHAEQVRNNYRIWQAQQKEG
jgi:hypothetical protein